LLTNAAGAINRRYRPGEFMLLEDHINFMGANPLRGLRGLEERRFLDLQDLYDRVLGRQLMQSARAVGARLHRGVYLAVSGPTYETPAEIRAFARMGADAVGMSTVPEAIVARQSGMRVAGLSCLTNLAAGRSGRPLTHSGVLSVAKEARLVSGALLRTFVKLHAQNTK
jgi:purine-nucleoside phosphorylase